MLHHHRFNLALIGSGRTILPLAESFLFHITENNMKSFIHLHIPMPDELRQKKNTVLELNLKSKLEKSHLMMYDDLAKIKNLHHQLDMILIGCGVSSEREEVILEHFANSAPNPPAIGLINFSTIGDGRKHVFLHKHHLLHSKIRPRIFDINVELLKEEPYIQFKLSKMLFHDQLKKPRSFFEKINGNASNAQNTVLSNRQTKKVLKT